MYKIKLNHTTFDGEIDEEIVNLDLDKITFNEIVELKNTIENTEVYDLLVETIPNYTTKNSIVHNGGGKRKGSFAIYLEPWHSDIYDFLDLRKNHGKEEQRARDLFTALWIPDLFMERVNNDEEWHLFSPDEAPGLDNVIGNDFVELYNKYVEEGKFRKVIKARDLWDKILDSQMETGTPYMLAKDAANLKSNQQNLGVIKSSNLCVAPETQILTSSGYQTISQLEGEIVEVWNGKEWSETKVVKTGENQKLIKINIKYNTFDDNDNIVDNDIVVISATEYHKWYDINNIELRTVDLYDGLELQKSLLPEGGYRTFKILSIEDNNRYDDTYCVNEPKEHKVIFNGVLTGNCTEIIEYSDDKEQAVCNLASIALSMYVDTKKKDIDYQKLYEVTYQATINLNRVIDVNYYPTKETKRSNIRHRPIGLGVQGLADVYAKLGLPFDSDKAKDINKKIFETIYFASMTASKDLAIKEGPYETFEESPLSKGIFQFDMWKNNTIVNEKTEDGKSRTIISEEKDIELSGMWDWNKLREEVIKYGVRNSLLVSPMPTASTASILGNNEAFEPFTSNIYKRNTLSGEFVMVNKHLVNDLIKLNLWNDEIRNKIILAEGSIQNIDEIPQNIKDIYKTVWEIKLRDQIDMSADRGVFICQSQSFNLHVADINKAKITTALMYGWRKGLKTLSYYIRGKSITSARKDLGIDSSYKTTQTIQDQIDNIACSLDNPEDCIACSA
jgi:ribonucleotide reductase alpha subunit